MSAFGTGRPFTSAHFKRSLDADNTVSLHSDTPIGPPKPLECAWIAVNRLGLSGKVLARAERLTVD